MLDKKEDTAINNLSTSIPNIELFLSKVNTKHSFHEFIKQAWPAIEGGVSFVDSWHIHAIAEHLEACYRRDIKKLLINIPPRTSKSTIVSGVHLNKGTQSTTGNFWSRGMVSFCSNFIPPIYQ